MKKVLILVMCVSIALLCLQTWVVNASEFPSYSVLAEDDLKPYGFVWAREALDNNGYTAEEYPYIVYSIMNCEGTKYFYIFVSEQPVYIMANTEGKYYLSPLSGKFLCSRVHGNGTKRVTEEVLLLDGESIQLYSEYSISDLSGNVFFQGAPVPPPMTELGKVLKTAVQKKSPITQVIYLVPLLISLVASFLGLRKGLQMLRTILSKG